jgi:L-alanine-DL-glutamate epimerase-like enolase superfamily enzyme
MPDDLVGYARLARFVDTPIAAGEEEASVNGYVRLMDAGIDYIQVDVTKCGLTMAMQVAAIAHQRGLPCINHNYSNDFNTAASLHFLAAIPNAFILEYGYGLAEQSLALVRNPIVVDAGLAHVPMEPGLGVEPDMAIVERYVVRD